MRRLALLPICLILASCTSFGSVDRRAALKGAIVPVRATVDRSLLQRCPTPLAKPDVATDAQVGRLWDRDRAALRECGARHAALAQSVLVTEAK